MTTSYPSGLVSGDRVLFRSVVSVGCEPLERTGVLIDDPMGKWVRVQYDDQVEPDSALVETLTRVES